MWFGDKSNASILCKTKKLMISVVNNFVAIRVHSSAFTRCTGMHHKVSAGAEALYRTEQRRRALAFLSEDCVTARASPKC